MPAWIAGIHQVRKDASGDIHVSLDSSAPCWNDAIEGGLLEAAVPVFSKENFVAEYSGSLAQLLSLYKAVWFAASGVQFASLSCLFSMRSIRPFFRM